MVGGILLKGILAKLWAMISTFQLIQVLSIIPVSVPTNVINVQTQSNAIINFNPVPKDLIMELIFGPKAEDFPESKPISPPPELRYLAEEEEEVESTSPLANEEEEEPAEESNSLLDSFDLSEAGVKKMLIVLAVVLGVVLVLVLLVICCLKLCQR